MSERSRLKVLEDFLGNVADERNWESRTWVGKRGLWGWAIELVGGKERLPDSCTMCAFHMGISDPDPDNPNGYQEITITCTRAKNPNVDLKSRRTAARQQFRPVALVSGMGANVKVPDWCPIRKNESNVVPIKES